MSTTTLAISAFSGLVVAALYTVVGYRLQGRAVSREARTAQNLFIAWWYAIAASSTLTAVTLTAYTAGNLPKWLYQVNSQMGLLALTVALWGLLSYLVYLYTGSRRAHLWIGGFYVLFYVLLQAAVAYFGPPDQISDNGWTLTTLYEDENGELGVAIQLSRAWIIVILVALVGPQFGAAVAYARLYKRAQDATQRYRIAMISGSIIVWFGTSLVAGSLGVEGITWQVVSRVLSLLAASAILMAYYPPAFLRRRWGLRALKDDAVPLPE